MARIQRGDLEAYTQLVDRYQGPLLGFVFNLVRDRQLAQDLAQDVFLKAYKSIRNYEARDNATFSTWLFSIARNSCLDALRQGRWKHEEISDEEPVFQITPSQTGHLNGVRFRQALEKSLGTLSVELRMAFELTLVQGLSYDDAAEYLEKAGGHVKTALVMIKAHVSGEEARRRLKKADGFVRAAVENKEYKII